MHNRRFQTYGKNSNGNTIMKCVHVCICIYIHLYTHIYTYLVGRPEKAEDLDYK